jgi:hypothetical protein
MKGLRKYGRDTGQLQQFSRHGRRKSHDFHTSCLSPLVRLFHDPEQSWIFARNRQPRFPESPASHPEKSTAYGMAVTK